MKKATFLFILLFITVVIKAQVYEISFTGSGQSTNVDSVFVENLTQGTTIELAGSDILLLVEETSIASQSLTNEDLHIYPNPMKETSKLEFYIGQPDDVKIEIYDVGGKLIVSQSGKVNLGTNIFEISGIPEGFYTAKITTSAWQKSSGFISVNNEVNTPAINSVSELIIEPQTKSLKSTKNLVEMQYNDGDILLFKGVAGDYARVLTKVPTQTQTINFEFVPCTDLGGNHYAVVTIGNQTWMAENLAYLPEITFEDDWGSYTDPQYAVYDYAPGSGTETVAGAKATANYDTYGVLYNWPAAMDGDASSSSNPSGVQGICPNGWHLPSDDEWTELTDYLGDAGGKLKATGTIEASTGLWYDPNEGATNETGFTALPGGYRGGYGYFDGIGYFGYWWSATEYNTYVAWRRYMYYNLSDVVRGGDFKESGFSVRCLRD
jgi:uncharacterized protein (TIGR02145 family)